MGHALHLPIQLIQSVQNRQASVGTAVGGCSPAPGAAQLCGAWGVAQLHAGATQLHLKLLHPLPQVITLDVGIHL